MMQCLQTAAYLKPIKLQSRGLGRTTGAIFGKQMIDEFLEVY